MESTFSTVYVEVSKIEKLLEAARNIGSRSVSFGVEDNHIYGQRILWVAGYEGPDAKRTVIKLDEPFTV